LSSFSLSVFHARKSRSAQATSEPSADGKNFSTSPELLSEISFYVSRALEKAFQKPIRNGKKIFFSALISRFRTD
jgi:hypothetical protein